MTILHIVGARPNFPKAAPVMRALAERGIEQQLIHTGQHYDDHMSAVFFRELSLPEPDINLGIGSGSHTAQTANLMIALEPIIADPNVDLVMVYGDVNSTISAALVAAKLGVPLAHVEAGLRSFDRDMPEEINRVLTDQLSELLFATSPDAIAHLANEGIPAEKIHFVGNPMIDTLMANADRFDVAQARADHDLDGPYAVVTLHRPANVDSDEAALRVLKAIDQVAMHRTVVFPVHPRGRERLMRLGLGGIKKTIICDPLGYIDFLSLVRGADVVVTDSGGIQEETTILAVPCLTLRTTTERPVTITDGTNRLVSFENLENELQLVLQRTPLDNQVTPALWDGQAGRRIARIVENWLRGRA